MSNFDLIENDDHYKELSLLVRSSNLALVDQILFLAVFESWFHFQDRALYESIVKKAIEVFEEDSLYARY